MGLSAEQQAAVRHIWSSPDRVILIEGDAGTGKTDAMKVTIPGIDRPGVFLAPSASASRGTLREKGFANADTIARFLDRRGVPAAGQERLHLHRRGAAGRASGRSPQVFDQAKELNARVILQGDRKQHSSPERGAVFHVLEEYACLPVARLTEIFRQQDKSYKRAVAAIAKGDLGGGFDLLNSTGLDQGDPGLRPQQAAGRGLFGGDRGEEAGRQAGRGAQWWRRRTKRARS